MQRCLLGKTRHGWPTVMSSTLTRNTQIWFQNRRQNDRRKSRPLSPQELAALRFNGLQSTPAPDSLAPFSVGPNFHHATDPSMSHPSNYDAVRMPVNGHQDQQQLPVANTGSLHMSMSQQSAVTTQPSEAPSSQASQEGSQTLSQSFSSSVGYLANRWNLGNSFSSQPNPHHEADTSLRQVKNDHTT